MRAAAARAWLCLAVAAALIGAAVGSGVALGDPGSEKDSVDAQLGQARSALEGAQARESVLTSELSALIAQERTAQAAVDGAAAELGRLEGRLAAQRQVLARLDARLRDQTTRLGLLEGQLDVSITRLERRVRELYMTDSPDVLSFLVGADSFTDVLDNMDLLRRIGRQDERIVADVEGARDAMRRARAATRRTRGEAKVAEQAIAADTASQRATTQELAAHRDALTAAASERSSALASIREDKASYLAEVEGLEAQSAALAEEIRRQQAAAAAEAARQEAARQAAASSSADPAPAPVATGSSGGRLSWPVGGPVTSGFGMRWGRMHEGVDIAVPEGTPVAAAGAGTVITAGWMGGYGYLVVIDHGGGLATAYGHNSALSVSVGQSVAAGQVIASSGNTGHSTGPHVHFEARVNGAAVDPLGYL